MTAKEEQKNKKIGVLTSVGFHLVLLVLFMFLLAWSEPDPPIPEYGIELSFIQSNSTGPERTEEENEESARQESQQEEVTEETEESSASEEVVEQVEESPPTPAEAESQEPVETETDLVETEDINSPDVVEEPEVVEVETEVMEAEPESESVDSDEVQEQVEETENQQEREVNEQQVDNPKPVEEPAPQIDSRAIYTGKKGTGESDSNSSTSSGGASLDLSGWIWDFEPEPDDQSDESGKIVFQIIVDEEGEIVGLKTLEKTVSPVVEKKYRDSVMDLTFSKTSENSSVAATSTGRITFIIKSR